MKYKWGGLLEAVEEADGKHENKKLEKAQKIIRILEETKNVFQVEKILIFLKEYQDFLCSPLLDDLFRCKYYFPTSYLQFIETGNLELCRFLFDKFGPEFTKFIGREESEALGKAPLEIIQFFMERGIGHDDNNLFGAAIATGDVKKVEYVLTFMAKPLHTIPWLGYINILSFDIVKYIFDALDESLKPNFLARVNLYHSFDTKTLDFLTQNIIEEENMNYTEILNNCFTKNNIELLKHIQNRFTDKDFLHSIKHPYMNIDEENICVQYLLENNYISKQMIKNALPSFFIKGASKEDIENILQNKTSFRDCETQQIFIEKCIEYSQSDQTPLGGYQLTNTNIFYKFLCKNVKNIRYMVTNRPDLVDTDKCLQEIAGNCTDAMEL